MIPADEFVWMTSVLSAWRNDGRVWHALGLYRKYAGFTTLEPVIAEVRGLKSGSPYIPRTLLVRAWLAEYFRPVSDALWDGATDEQALRIWQGLEACRSGPAIPYKKSRTAYDKRSLDAARLASQEYARGWRAKHDWKTVK